MREATRGAMQCTGGDYAAAMPTDRPDQAEQSKSRKRKTTQHTVGVDDELWNDCLAIAGVRRQRLSQVLRDALVDYRSEHFALLTEIKASAAASPVSETPPDQKD